jgi:uncharacterized membrane protein
MKRFLAPADNWRLGIIALAVLIFSIAWPLTPISIEWATFCRAFLLIGFVVGIGLTYRGLNRDDGIAAVWRRSSCFPISPPSVRAA